MIRFCWLPKAARKGWSWHDIYQVNKADMKTLTTEMAAAMIHHEEVFRYWKQQKQSSRLPARADIDPCGFRKVLPTISLIDVLEPEPQNNPLAFRQRLAGTELYSAYGTEITGKRLNEIYNPSQADYWARELSEIVTTKKPNIGLYPLSATGSKGLYLFWLRMPLAKDGFKVDMILGHDVVLGRDEVDLHSGIRAA